MSEPEHNSVDKRGFLSTPVICPHGHEKTTAYIPYSKATHFQKYGPQHKFYELLHLLRPTLADPDAYFPYVADDFAGFCYTGRLSFAYTNRGQQVEPPEGMVFVVFLTDNLKVTDWGWEYHDRDDPVRPLVSEGRLEEALWSRQ